MNPSTPRWLSTREIAQQLAVKPERVITWIRRGQLRAVNVGDGSVKPRFRIAPADLQVFLLARTVQPPTPTPRRRRRQTEGVTEYF
jgi:excisionase family DNA binding protein